MQDSSALSSATPDERLSEADELRARIAELERQVNDYRQLAERLGDLPKARDADDRQFFPVMAETLAKTLSADYIVVGELCPNNKVIRAPRFSREGRF